MLVNKLGFSNFPFLTHFAVTICLFSIFGIVSANNLPEDAPILISQSGSTRAFATVSDRKGKTSEINLIESSRQKTVTFYLTNLKNLLEGEGASAFRAEFEDARQVRYPLQVVSIEPSKEYKNVYALNVRFVQVSQIGDVLVRVTWRGMSSNRVRFAIGFEGGKIQDDIDATPTPISNAQLPIKTPQKNNVVGLPWSGDLVRFMSQATFGANAGLESRIRRLGYRIWIEQQMDEGLFLSYVYPEFPLQVTNPLSTCDGNPQPVDVPITCFRDNYTMFPLQNWFFREALYNENQQLRRRASWALHQIFVVSGRTVKQPSRMMPYIQILDKNAFGNYRTLLKEITLNPAMGEYLDMAISTSQNPNENYAREILQLFSIGLDMLNQDGTPMLDGQGNRIPTYNQENIVNFAKIFTGWTYCNQSCLNSQPGIVNYRDQMIVLSANHDATSKTLLNYAGAVPFIPAGQTPDQDLDAALDNIFYHPNTAPFISKLLIQQLVTSNPTPAYVGRIAAIFRDNGQGIRGDLKAVFRAILLDPEARGNIKTDPNYGKLREPVLFITSVLRLFNPTANNNISVPASCNGLSDGSINTLTQGLDQDVWNPPTVFNYYPMDYTIPNTSLAGPEFQIFSTGTALKRPNVMNQFAPANLTTSGGIAATTGVASNIPCGTRIDIARLQSLISADTTGASLVDILNRDLMNGSMSAAVRQDILTAVQAVSSTNTLKRARTALYLVATSPQYQVQK
jgi:uncharacterized protein (DUF1800 family)